MVMTMHCEIASAEEEIFSGSVGAACSCGKLGRSGYSPGTRTIAYDIDSWPFAH